MERFTTNDIKDFEIEHFNKIRELGPECTLFLKKDNTFPLMNPMDISAFGSGVRHTIKGGLGSGDTNIRGFKTIEEVLKENGFNIKNEKYLDKLDEIINEHNEKTPNEALEYNISIDYESDLAIYVLTRNSCEGVDRRNVKGDIQLTEVETREILELNKRYKYFMLVLNTIGYVDLKEVKDVKNIFYLGQLGSCTSLVFVDILLGKSYPSGKLAMTWTGIDEYPTTIGFGGLSNTKYREGIYVGYRYFMTKGADVDFPFGFGLSYTTFDINFKKAVMINGKTVIDVLVMNKGKEKGKEVVCLYVNKGGDKTNKPYLELVDFKKTNEINPGEYEIISLSLDPTLLSSYDSDNDTTVIEKGSYSLRIGNDVTKTKLVFGIDVDKDIILSRHKSMFEDVSVEDLVLENIHDDLSTTRRFKISADKFSEKEFDYDFDYCREETEEDVSFEDVLNQSKTVEQFVSKMSIDELIELVNGRYKNKLNDSTVYGSPGQLSDVLDEYGIEGLVTADGPQGLRLEKEYKIGDETYYQFTTAIPNETAVAQSFSEDLAYKMAQIVAEEMKTYGVDLWLAPALNIQRSPFCGRNFEYYSEDPFLTYKMASNITKGIQENKGLGVVIKHFACNNQETNRKLSNSILTIKTLREIYLKAFELVIKENSPVSVMSSYNLIDGQHTMASEDLLSNILRCEWGFDGFVMSDWDKTDKEATMKQAQGSIWEVVDAHECTVAGCDLIMPGFESDVEEMKEAYKKGDIWRSHLEIAAIRILKTIIKLKY